MNEDEETDKASKRRFWPSPVGCVVLLLVPFLAWLGLWLVTGGLTPYRVKAKLTPATLVQIRDWLSSQTVAPYRLRPVPRSEWPPVIVALEPMSAELLAKELKMVDGQWVDVQTSVTLHIEWAYFGARCNLMIAPAGGRCAYPSQSPKSRLDDSAFFWNQAH